MTTDSDESNPYRSPQESCEVPSAPDSVRENRLLWPIAVGFILCFGVFLVLGGLFMLGNGFWQMAQHRGVPRSMGTGIFIVPGVEFAYAARMLKKGRRRRGMLVLALGSMTYGIFAGITEYFGLG